MILIGMYVSVDYWSKTIDDLTAIIQMPDTTTSDI